MISMDPAQLGKISLALALGAIGGLLATWATIPLPWMLGPMIVCTVAAVAGLPIAGPMPIRPPMVMILGVMLGSGFTPDMIDQAGQWAVSLSLLAVYVGLGGALCYHYFRRVAGYDKPTAYFAGMPGGLNEMMLIAAELGGDERRIVLTHASRILLTVLTIPVLFRLTTDIDMTDRSRLGVGIMDVAPVDYVLLAGCIVGYPVAKYLKIPAPMLVGPMGASAILHLAGGSEAQPPLLIVNIAQWVMGTVIGCRFIGIARSEVFKTIQMSIGSTAILLALTGVFGIAIQWAGAAPLASTVLAYAPGGLAEMSLVALALGADVAFVATHHIIRIIYVVIAAPVAYRLWLGRDP